MCSNSIGTKNERKIWKLWNHAVLEILLLCMEIFVYIIVVVVFIYDSKVPSSQFTLFCHYRQPSPQTFPNAMPHSTSTTTVAREQVFICQERINIPRKFISLNRQRAQRIFLLWLYANNECAFSLSRAPFLASTNALFPFHESHSQCLRFFREITEDDNEGWWVSWVGEDHYDVICLAKI